MNQLQQRGSFDLDSMSSALGNITPPQLPSLNPRAGVIGHWVHGKKMEMAAKSYKHEAEIAMHQRDMVNARVDMIISVLTAGDRFKEASRRIQHNITMMELTEYKEQCICRRLNAEANEAEYSAKTAELEFLARQRAMQGVY